MKTLEQCFAEWIVLSRTLHSEGVDVCAPFFSHEPDNYSSQLTRILLIGKATDGWGWHADVDAGSDLSNLELALHQRQETYSFQKWRASHPKKHPGFWQFKTRLACAFGDHGAYPQNLIWSNMFKIGALKVSSAPANPNSRLIKVQQKLAVETIAAEIRTYKPTLVVFTSVGYNEDVIHDAVGRDYKSNWLVEAEATAEESWALSIGELPKMLWIRHPARKSYATMDAWIARATALEAISTKAPSL